MTPLRDQFRAFVSHPLTGVQVGYFALFDNTELCTSFLSFVAAQAEAGGQAIFPSFEQWQRFLKADHRPPKPPDRDDPYLYPNPRYIGRQDKEAVVYRAYTYVKHYKQWQRAHHQAKAKAEKQRQVKLKYSHDKKGYCQYIWDRLDSVDQAFLKHRQSFFIPESERKKHSYISGGSGSGKSELLKSIIHYYLTEDTHSALVLMDPHGKIAEEVAKFKENINSERLIFIAPDLARHYSPVFNPFDVKPHLDAQDLDIAAQELVGAFREILGEAGFSAQMETLLKPCLSTLLLHPDGDLYKLQQMMDNEEGREWLNFAFEHLKNPAQIHFLKTDFFKPAYQPSRQSIRTKIQSLLNSSIFLNFIVGTSTFSLQDAIQQKKLIIFSLSRNTGAETSDTIGRLILSSLQSLAMQRAGLPVEALDKVPAIHLFIDEFQHYITSSIETILTESRKYKLHLTVANQFLDQIDDRRVKNAIKGNTAVKITGKQTEPSTLENMARTTGTESNAIRNLKTGEYFIKAGTLTSTRVAGKTNTLDQTNSMAPEQWERVKAYQLSHYYRTLDVEPKQTDLNQTESSNLVPSASRSDPTTSAISDSHLNSHPKPDHQHHKPRQKRRGLN